MARCHKPEEIIGKLREAEIVLGQNSAVASEVATSTTAITEGPPAGCELINK